MFAVVINCILSLAESSCRLLEATRRDVPHISEVRTTTLLDMACLLLHACYSKLWNGFVLTRRLCEVIFLHAVFH